MFLGGQGLGMAIRATSATSFDLAFGALTTKAHQLSVVMYTGLMAVLPVS